MSNPQTHVHFYSSEGFEGTDLGCTWLMIWPLPASTGEKYRLKENYFCLLWVSEPERTWHLCSVVERSREGGSAHRELSRERALMLYNHLQANLNVLNFRLINQVVRIPCFYDAQWGNPAEISFNSFDVVLVPTTSPQFIPCGEMVQQ